MTSECVFVKIHELVDPVTLSPPFFFIPLSCPRRKEGGVGPTPLVTGHTKVHSRKRVLYFKSNLIFFPSFLFHCQCLRPRGVCTINFTFISFQFHCPFLCVCVGIVQTVVGEVEGKPLFTRKNTVEIAQLWQHNRGNYTTPTIYQKKKKTFPRTGHAPRNTVAKRLCISSQILENTCVF